ncbi:hypothetical protein SAMN05660649_04477 [Desulfotomaculum arcticum]|uniref:Uncharacterized protein n=1 Tax=Desulfotruncus arcticus DSM 17038 TaxID=1121424 RepID=A0A1I2YKT9_9FIRM|nr:hypothetical protein SAMN05660649_04477 [Desulfotomaculum arcticum] [Desulfotruncus arcticus DSM 17038]
MHRVTRYHHILELHKNQWFSVYLFILLKNSFRRPPSAVARIHSQNQQGLLTFISEKALVFHAFWRRVRDSNPGDRSSQPTRFRVEGGLSKIIYYCQNSSLCSGITLTNSIKKISYIITIKGHFLYFMIRVHKTLQQKLPVRQVYAPGNQADYMPPTRQRPAIFRLCAPAGIISGSLHPLFAEVPVRPYAYFPDAPNFFLPMVSGIHCTGRTIPGYHPGCLQGGYVKNSGQKIRNITICAAPKTLPSITVHNK